MKVNIIIRVWSQYCGTYFTKEKPLYPRERLRNLALRQSETGTHFFHKSVYYSFSSKYINCRKFPCHVDNFINNLIMVRYFFTAMCNFIFQWNNFLNISKSSDTLKRAFIQVFNLAKSTLDLSNFSGIYLTFLWLVWLYSLCMTIYLLIFRLYF